MQDYQLNYNNMKTKLLLLSLLAFAAVACNKSDKEADAPRAGDFKGVVTVTFQESDFDNEDISVSYSPSEDGNSAELSIFQIKFVPQMPVTIDVTIPSIKVAAIKDGVSLSCDSVVPLAMGGEYPRYTVTGLSGTIIGDDMTFSLKFGDYPTSFKGKRVK